MNIFLLGYFEDKHSAVYINDSFIDLGHKVGHIDIRKCVKENGFDAAQSIIIDKVSTFKDTEHPDMILVLKGLEMSADTLQQIKNMFPKTKLVNWFFDIYVDTKLIWEHTAYHDIIKMYDYYFCSCKECVTQLNKIGLDNVFWLQQGCYPEANGEVYLNNYQKKIYGSDIAFMGSIGYYNIHKDRLSTLLNIVNHGFDLKIYGDVLCDKRILPPVLKPVITGKKVINEEHSMVCQASNIVLGIDANKDFELSNSVRLFKVMCAGGLMLNSATKNLDSVFKTNKPGEPLTTDLDMVVFYDNQDLIEKLDFLFEHDSIRKQIAKNGQKTVLDNHKYSDRLLNMLDKVFPKNASKNK